MKKLTLISFVLFLSTFAFGQKQLTDFDALMESLNSGHHVKAVFHYGQCQLISDNEVSEDSIDAIGGMPLETYEFFAKGSIRNKQAFVVFSEVKLIQNPIGDGYVYNYVKIKVYEDGKVKITAEYVDPKSYEVKMTEKFFGEINDGKNEAGIYFYQS